MAVNCSVRPLATDGFTGVTAIEVSAAAVTVSVVDCARDPADRGGDRRRARGQRRGQAARWRWSRPTVLPKSRSPSW